MNSRIFHMFWSAGLTLAMFAGGVLLGAPDPKAAASPQTPAQGTAQGQTTAPPGTATQGARGRGTPGQTPAGQSPAAPSRGGQVPGRPDSNGPRPPWWKDEAIKKEIGLRENQALNIDRLYDNRARDIAPWNDEIMKQREQLNVLMLDRTATRTAIELQVDRMEVPRMKVNESYFVMLHRMYMQLDPDQNKKLQAIFDRNRDHGRGGGSPK